MAQQITDWMKNLARAVRYGFRTLRKSPGFTLAAVVTLALGIGANTAVFSVADAFLLHPLSLPRVDRVVMVMELSPGQNSGWSTVASGNFARWREQSQSFEPMAGGKWANFNLTGRGDPQRLQAFVVTSEFFERLGVAPEAGRTFLPGEDQPGQNGEVVLSFGLWQRQFGSDRGIVGNSVLLDGRPYVVVGVMPKSFRFPLAADIWIPLAMTKAEKLNHSTHSFFVVTRLKPNVSLQQAQGEMNGIVSQLAQEYPQTNKNWGVHVMPIASFVTGDLTRSYTVMLLVAVGFVLLIGCVNVANLQFARGTTRQKELAVRLSLGADRKRIVYQLLTENLLLSLTAALLSLALAWWAVHLIVANMPPDVARYFPGWEQIAVDWRALAYAFAVAVLAGVVSGLAPAWQSARVEMQSNLKELGTSGGHSSSRQRIRSLFVVLQVALSLVLLVGAGLTAKGVGALLKNNEAYSPKSVLTFQLKLPATRYQNPTQMIAFYDRMLAETGSIRGVQGASISNYLPFSGGGDIYTSLFSIEGRPVTSTRDVRSAVFQHVSPGFFPLLHIELKQGRLLTDDDGPSSPPVALIDERMARLYWPKANPLGQRIKFGGTDSKEPWMSVVGVVASIKNSWVNEQPDPTIYTSYQQSPLPYTYVSLRADDLPSALHVLQKRISQIDGDLPLYQPKSLDQLVHESVVGLEYVAVMMSILGSIALVLAAVGVYGVMAYSVGQRTQEIGIRMALGAQRGEVLGLILRWGLILVAIGIAVGLTTSLALARLLANLLYGVNSTDALVFFSAGITLSLTALMAVYLPAWRATKVDPMIALRYE